MKTIFRRLLLILIITLLSSVDLMADDIRQFDTEIIETLGQEIYRRDYLAATATDILFTQDFDLVNYGLIGWIVVDDSDNVVVRFIRKIDDQYRTGYDVRFTLNDSIIIAEAEQESLTAEQAARFKARQLALNNIPEKCSKVFNTVVLTDTDDDGYLVYTLAATTDPNVIMVGGHYRFTISSDGEQIEQVDKLFRSCLTMYLNPPDMPEGSEPAGYAVTHLVSDTPVETHIFLSLLYDKPFFVTTPDDKIWKVENGTMEIVQE